jgi:starvation-inducible outer membrane lipoprotein
MKRSDIPFLIGLVILVLSVFLSGCSSFPKDAYGEGVEIRSIWVQSKADVLATGKAALEAAKDHPYTVTEDLPTRK